MRGGEKKTNAAATMLVTHRESHTFLVALTINAQGDADSTKEHTSMEFKKVQIIHTLLSFSVLKSQLQDSLRHGMKYCNYIALICVKSRGWNSTNIQVIIYSSSLEV